MNERWVCKRCYADNEGEATSCARCGLPRGAEVTPQAQQEWQAQAQPGQPAQPVPAWRGLLRFAWIPVVAVVLVIGFFAQQGARDLENLAVGDCFDTGDTEVLTEVDSKECDEPHQYEVVHVATWTGPDDTYPSGTAQDDFIATECLPAFAQYVGTDFETSSLFMTTITPSEESWADGDRAFVCAAYDRDNPLNSSVRDSGL
jgi:hypothetical protein